jgi:hypothetical protein
MCKILASEQTASNNLPKELERGEFKFFCQSVYRVFISDFSKEFKKSKGKFKISSSVKLSKSKDKATLFGSFIANSPPKSLKYFK